MAYMRFCGEVGRELSDRVAHCRRWLANGHAVAELRGSERRSAEEELIAFLLNARFGEKAIIDQGFESQLDYIRQTHAWNPHCFKLLKGREPLTVDAETPDGVVQMAFGYARGVSMVVPMTEAGYEAYTARKIWSLEIRREHVVPPENVPADPCYVYLGTLFDFPALPRLLGERGHLVKTVGTPLDSAPLLRQLFRHAARFFPRVRYDSESKRWVSEGDDPNRLPTFICATDSEFGDGLTSDAGFWPCGDGVNKLGLLLLGLRVEDVNDEAVSPERRSRIENTLRAYRSLLKKKPR